MKKFFIFVAIAMVFVMLTSGLAIGRKAADKDKEETGGIITVVPGTTATTTEAPGIQEGLFYAISGHSYTEEQLPTLTDATYVYFSKGNVTYFARVFTEYSTQGSIEFVYNPDAVSEYNDSYCYKMLDDSGALVTLDSFDLVDVPSDCYGTGSPDGWDVPGGRVVAVFLELEDCSDPASVLSKFVDNVDFCANAQVNSPEEIEGPSAEETTAATAPQVDPWIPEGPGAE